MATMGYEKFTERGQKIIDRLQNGKDEIMVILFYNPVSKRQNYKLEQENMEVINNLVTHVLLPQHENPLNLAYTSIDVTDHENKKLLRKVDIDPSMTDKGPIVLASRKGKGTYMWGPTVLNKIIEVVEELQLEASKN